MPPPLIAARRAVGDPHGTRADGAEVVGLWPPWPLRSCRCSPTRFGWIFTEMGRQPWVVFGLMTTAQRGLAGVSASARSVTSLIVFTLLYGVLAVVEIRLFLHYVRQGAEPFEEPQRHRRRPDEDAPLAFAY